MRAVTAILLVGLVMPTLAVAQPTPTDPTTPVLSQTVVSVEDPARALQPGAFEGLVALVRYQWNSGAAPSPGTDPTTTENDTRPTRIHLAVKAKPSWVANVTFERDVVEIDVDPGIADSRQLPVVLILGIAPDAPALQREEIIITATAEPNGNIAASTGESPPLKLRGAIVSKINVTSPPSQIVHGGRWTNMPFTIRNDGNMELKVKLNVTARPQDSQVRFPETVTIPRNESVVVDVELRVPWTYGIGGIVELEAVALLDDDEAKPARSSIDVLGQSAVPGPSIFLSLVAALLLWRRRS